MPRLALCLWLAVPLGAAAEPPRFAAHPVAAQTSLPAGLSQIDQGLIYRPQRSAETWPLLVLLHGAGDDARNMIRVLQADADRGSYIILAPKSQGLTWDLFDDAAYAHDPPRIDAAVRSLFAKAPIDRERVAIAGFSDGASYALALGIANPQLFRGVMALSAGFLHMPAQVDPAQRLFISHGRRDPILSWRRVARDIVPRLEKAGLRPRTRWFAGGHRIDKSSYAEAVDYVLNLSDAAGMFRRAFGSAGSAIVTLDGEKIKYEPVAMTEVAGQRVLVARGTVIDAAHVTSGKVATIYFDKDGRALSRNLKAVESGSSGVIANVAVSKAFGPLPVIVSEGGGTWQGYSCDMVKLVELTPGGPRELADIPTYYDDSGIDEKAGNGITLTGKIANIQPGKSFDVVYSGSRTFTETWVRRGDKYELDGETKMLSC